MKQKLLSLLLVLALVVTTLAGCTENDTRPDTDLPGSQAVSAKPTVDRAGNAIQVPDEVDRIVSTAPASTEILVGLGLADKLVMIDTYSADVAGLPAGLPQVNFPDVDAEALIGMEPDLVLVSSYYPEAGHDPLKLIRDAGICVAYILSSESAAGILEDIRFLGALTGADEAAEQMAAEFQTEVDRIRAIGETVTEKKTVYFEIGSSAGLYSFGGGTFLNEFIELAGGVNIFADEAGWLSPDPEAVLSADPDVILTNESYLDDPVNGIRTRDGWDTVTAVQNGAVYLLDANETSRASQNAVNALRDIAKAIHPDLYE